MALFTIKNYYDFLTKGYHNATTWEVALDPEFTQIIDRTVKDTTNVKYWHSMLPKITGTGYYADLDKVYARCKVFIDDDESDWFIVEPVNQNDQIITYTEDGKEDIIVNSLEIGMN